jgi:hypothetical protein
MRTIIKLDGTNDRQVVRSADDEVEMFRNDSIQRLLPAFSVHAATRLDDVHYPHFAKDAVLRAYCLFENAEKGPFGRRKQKLLPLVWKLDRWNKPRLEHGNECNQHEQRDYRQY